MVKYVYDAWGVCDTIVLDENAANIANLNPFRYRSYYLDTGLNLYYLKTRYYDPNICRFITIDDISYLAPDTINGLNLYAYCFNNPIVFCDINGTNPLVIAGVGFLGFALLALGVAMVGAMTQTAPETSITLPRLENVLNGLYLLSALIGLIGADTVTEDVVVEPPSSNTVIYRYGGTSPSNLTPNEKDVKYYPTTGKGLSFSTVPKPGAAMTTIEEINATGVLYAVVDGETHVSVFPVNGTIEEWYDAGTSSLWTTTLKTLVTKYRG